MLSKISWPQFWIFIAAAVMIYYIVVVLIFFRQEALSMFSGKGTSKKQLDKQSRNITTELVIGASQDSNEILSKGFESQNSEIFPENIREKVDFPENVNNIAEESYEVTSSMDNLSDEVNNSLLEEELLTAEFIARVNAGLEDEQIQELGFSVVEEIQLENSPTFDSEDFFRLIQSGIDELHSDLEEDTHQIIAQEEESPEEETLEASAITATSTESIEPATDESEDDIPVYQEDKEADSEANFNYQEQTDEVYAETESQQEEEDVWGNTAVA